MPYGGRDKADCEGLVPPSTLRKFKFVCRVKVGRILNTFLFYNQRVMAEGRRSHAWGWMIFHLPHEIMIIFPFKAHITYFKMFFKWTGCCPGSEKSQEMMKMFSEGTASLVHSHLLDCRSPLLQVSSAAVVYRQVTPVAAQLKTSHCCSFHDRFNVLKSRTIKGYLKWFPFIPCNFLL